MIHIYYILIVIAATSKDMDRKRNIKDHYFFHPILLMTNSYERNAVPFTGKDLSMVIPNPLKKVRYPYA